MRIYGPVLSWRLGRSLGIDIIGPEKTCCFDCVYCQLGKTVRILESPVKMDFDIIAELKNKLSQLDINSIDYVTFSGMGEPTLNLNLGKFVNQVRKITDKPIAALTNSAFIMRNDVRKNLKNIDLVVTKLDAPDQELFEKINRPVKGIKIEDIIEGLKKFKGKLAIQCMFLESNEFTNTGQETLQKLRKILVEINPLEVQVDTPYRPTSESGIHAMPEEKLKKIADFFKQAGLKVIYYQKKPPRKVIWKIKKNAKQRILELLRRRPCKIDEIANSVGFPVSSVIPVISELKKEDKIKEDKDFLVVHN